MKSDFINNMTHELKNVLDRSGIRSGVMNVFVTGSTGSVTTIEYEPGVVEDLKRAITGLAPPGEVYEHEMAWHDGNGHSHLRAAVLKASFSVPFEDSRMFLGTWQNIIFMDFDRKFLLRCKYRFY